MPETIGTLNLKIARLERHLKLLEQQRKMSRLYPVHEASLTRQLVRVQRELDYLARLRQKLLQLARAA